MNLRQIMGVLLILAGVGLTLVGRQKHGEVTESIGRFFNGSSSTETKLYLLGGVACLLTGIGALGAGGLGQGKQNK